MDEKDLLGRTLRMPGIDLGKEGQASGAVSSRVAQLLELLNENRIVSQAPISVDPGDYIRIGDDGLPGLALTLPIAYDVWYLWQTVNVLPAKDEDRDLFVKLVLKDLLTRLGGISPLRTVYRKSLSSGDIPDVFFFRNNGFYCIKEMRFETLLKDRSPEYPSPGSKRITESGRDHQGGGEGDIYSGYLAFPVGSLGVMETTALICTSLLDHLDKERGSQEYDGSYDALPGELLLPPFDSLNVNLKGLILHKKAYLQDCQDVEYPAAAMAGVDAVVPHHWERVWLSKENPWPLPGEFVGMIMKPLALPPHCWWFQETTPLMYAGNWFETDYYTSGIVLAVLEVVDEDLYEVTGVSGDNPQRTGYGDRVLSVGDQFDIEGIGNIYKVRVKDQDLYLRSTDFKDYSLNEVVAIIKRTGIEEKNFNWTKLDPGKRIPGETVDDIQSYDNEMAGSVFRINNKWVIGPITFYKEQ